MKLLNAFSINMLQDTSVPLNVNVKPLTVEVAKALLMGNGGIDSAVGHADTAAVLSDELGLHVNPNRVTVSLGIGDKAIVGQYIGPRLEEGTTSLPEGATIKWFQISIG